MIGIALRFCKHSVLFAVMVGVFLQVLLFVFVGEVQAIPAWARKYDLRCTSCHTRPPRLNKFGEAFHEMTFQLPMTREQEIRSKKKLGAVFVEKFLSNNLAIRANGNFVEYAAIKDKEDDLNFAFPNEVELFLTSNLTDHIALFGELELNLREVECKIDECEVTQEFGLGPEFFLMIDLAPLARKIGIPAMISGDPELVHSEFWSHGPMIMIGKVDPSTNFSYPTARQLMLAVPAEIRDEAMVRMPFSPYAFGAKFFGLFKGDEEELILPTTPILYNTAGDFGLDVHGRLFTNLLLYQFGVMQGGNVGLDDPTKAKDYYVALRLDVGETNFTRFSLSAFAYFGFETARLPLATDLSTAGEFVDWRRYGIGFNLVYKWLDLYGSYIFDQLRNVPDALQPVFDDDASGLTIEADFLLSEKWLLSLRYDLLDAGGVKVDTGSVIGRRRQGQTVGIQPRFYLRENIALFARYQVNLEKEEDHPLRSWRHAVFLGTDVVF